MGRTNDNTKLTKEDKGKGIAVEKSKTKRARPDPTAPLGGITINEPSQTGRSSRTSRNANLESEGTIANIQEPPNVQPAQRKTKPQPQAKTGSKQTPMRRDTSKNPTPSQLYQALMETHFVGTTYPDSETLKELGIFDEVELILNGMGIGTIMEMRNQGYKKLTCKFLATLKPFVYEGRQANEDGGGRIEFQDLDGATHVLTFQQMGEIYGFSSEGSEGFERAAGENDHIWKVIGSTTFTPAVTKAALIRHPAVRYVQKILTHSFFSRREGGNLLDGEMRFMRLGIGRIIRAAKGDDRYFPGLDYHQPNLIMVFVEQLLALKTWGWQRRDKTPQLSIGGWITPLLAASDITLPESGTAPRVMNLSYLNRAHFLAGRVKVNGVKKHIYRFTLHYNRLESVLLPNADITSFANPGNIDFEPDCFYDPAQAPPRQAPHGSRDSDPEPPSQDEDGTLYGPSRYYPSSSSAPPNPGPLRDLYMEHKKLSRWCLFQDRTTRKLVKQVKKLTAIILKGTTCKTCGSDVQFDHYQTPHQSENQDLQSNMEVDDEQVGRRNSYHGEESSAHTAIQPRSSVDDSGRRRRRRRPRRMPTPPPPQSDNESPPFSSDEEPFDPDFTYY